MAAARGKIDLGTAAAPGAAELNRVYMKTPAQIANLRHGFQKRVEAGDMKRLSLGIPYIDEVVTTMEPGSLVTLLARPSSGKTSLLTHMARIEADRIVAADTGRTEYVLVVSLEENEEPFDRALTRDVSTRDMVAGRYDHDELFMRNSHRVKYPVYIMGHEINERAAAILGDDEVPMLTIQQIWREIVQVQRDFDGLSPSAIFVDYLQILDVEGDPWGDKRHDVIGAALRGLKKLAKAARCPVVVGVQAKETVDNRKPFPIPEVADAYYSSEVSMHSDVILSEYYPWRYPADVHGGVVLWAGENRYVTPNLMCIQLLKQRYGLGRDRWFTGYDPAARHFYPLSYNPPALQAPTLTANGKVFA